MWYDIDPFLNFEPIFDDLLSTQERVQDFDIDPALTTMYVHPTGALGLYVYTFQTGTLEKLVEYSSGDFIATDSSFVFYETGGNWMYRYHLDNDSTDLPLSLSDLGYVSTRGLECYNDHLYALLENANDELSLLKFDYDGTLQSTTPIGEYNLAYLTIASHILHAINRGGSGDPPGATLFRLNLENNQILTELPFTTSSDGIRIVGDSFYFADGELKQVRSFLVDQLTTEQAE